MTSRWIIRLLWLAAGLAMLLAWQRDRILGWIPAPRELPRLDGLSGQRWIDEGFARGEEVPFLTQGHLPGKIRTATSWVGGDHWRGRGESAWFKANRWTIHVGVAGYPRHPGCALWAEFRDRHGAITRVDYALADVHESWSVWEIATPPGSVAVRIVGEDKAEDLFGWVGFSHPFRAWPRISTSFYLLLQVFSTTALALVVIWGPGLVWLNRKTTATPVMQTIGLIGSGPLFLALAGVIIWCLSGSIAPQMLGLILVGGGWLALGWPIWRGNCVLNVGAPTLRLLALSALVAVAVVAKSFSAQGPRGELFQGTVSRNFEMCDRVDSRYSFYVVQVATHHFGPASLASDKFFFPWTFFSRGPLAGLAALPVVMANDGHPSATMPEDRWNPFDRWGFATYRITMIVLASAVLVALGLVLAAFTGETWAFLGAGVLGLSPFGVHEILFTWPKWIATAWLIASFGLVHARRPLGAGVTLAIGYFYHPLVLLWGPWLALWAAGRAERNTRSVMTTWIRFGGAAGLLVAPWIALGAIVPHAPETSVAGQAGFFVYWARADWHNATWSTWWQTRWMNFANTFVPLHVYLDPASYHHPRLSSAYETSSPLLRFSQVWWVSLPFGLGLGLWAVSLAACGRAFRLVPAFVWLFLILPSLFITAYWGMDPLGLMRECGHPLFVAIIALTCWMGARGDERVGAVLRHRAVPWLQLPETWLMLWLTAFATPRIAPVEHNALDAAYLAINALALLATAWVVSRAQQADTPVEAKAFLAEYQPAT